MLQCSYCILANCYLAPMIPSCHEQGPVFLTFVGFSVSLVYAIAGVLQNPCVSDFVVFYCN